MPAKTARAAHYHMIYGNSSIEGLRVIPYHCKQGKGDRFTIHPVTEDPVGYSGYRCQISRDDIIKDLRGSAAYARELCFHFHDLFSDQRRIYKKDSE